MKTLITEYLAAILVFIPAGVSAAPKPIDTVGVSVIAHEQIKPLEVPQMASESKLEPVALPGYHGTGDYYLDWIIQHESGGNPHAMNSIGACGLGQSLPCSKVLSVCGTLDNVACQVEWVRNYCVSSYGSTQAAYNFWQSHHWY